MNPGRVIPQWMAAFLLAALVPSVARAGDEGAIKTSGNSELWAYGTSLNRTGDGPLNPNNLVAQVPDQQWTGEARLNLRLTMDSAEVVLRPRLLEQHKTGIKGDRNGDEAYLSQAFARLRLNDSLTLTAGRDLLTWGPGNFRSPSNPLNFDAGRTDPLRDVSGVDLARITYTRGPLSLMLAREQDAGHLQRAQTPEHTTLGKVDLRGDDTQFSIILATPVWEAPFFGGFAQATLGQAWLVYGELGSGRRPQALTANSAPIGAPFAVQAPSPRQTTTLLGTSYTLLNGQSISFEWLRDGHGFARQGESDFFARARVTSNQYLASPNTPSAPLQLAALGQGLSEAPALLGRDYASLLWQSNPQESGLYWRLMWTANLHDRSSQVTGYGEKSLSARFSVFAALNQNLGGVDSEYRNLIQTTLTLGVKYFAF